jgi:hypothetical protein
MRRHWFMPLSWRLSRRTRSITTVLVAAVGDNYSKLIIEEKRTLNVRLYEWLNKLCQRIATRFISVLFYWSVTICGQNTVNNNHISALLFGMFAKTLLSCIIQQYYSVLTVGYVLVNNSSNDINYEPQILICHTYSAKVKNFDFSRNESNTYFGTEREYVLTSLHVRYNLLSPHFTCTGRKWFIHYLNNKTKASAGASWSARTKPTTWNVRNCIMMCHFVGLKLSNFIFISSMGFAMEA